MIPRLAPRRSIRRSQLIPAPRPAQPLPVPALWAGTSEWASAGIPPLSPQPPPLKEHNSALCQRRVLSDKASSENAPLSPSPSISSLEPVKSPLSSDIFSESSCSDSTLTPPATGPRPLVVSAKRLGQDVRRKHSKRRRRRRGVAKNQNNGFCLWKDTDQETGTSQDSSSDEDDLDVRAGLPFLFSQQEVSPMEKTKHYWEWCYGKGTTIELSTTQGWSAKRAPPTKGCLSSLKKRRKPSPNDRFKTPPASPEELEEISKQSNQPKKSFRVQFGSPQAAEYEIDGPAGQLTPMPSREARERYSMDEKAKTEADEEITQETKQNSALLAEWEEEFKEPRSSSRRRRKNRRSSSLFTPSPMAVECDKDSNTTPPRDQLASSAPSPSVVVMENLASLRMGSPTKDSEPTGTKESSSCQHNLDTVEFRVSLESVNSTGGAMDTPSPGWST
jgi:hypothetical protein